MTGAGAGRPPDGAADSDDEWYAARREAEERAAREAAERSALRAARLKRWGTIAAAVLAGVVPANYGAIKAGSGANAGAVKEITEGRLRFEDRTADAFEALQKELGNLRGELENLRGDVNRSKASFTDFALALAARQGTRLEPPPPAGEGVGLGSPGATGRGAGVPAPAAGVHAATGRGALQEKLNAMAPVRLAPLPAAPAPKSLRAPDKERRKGLSDL